VVDPPAYFGKAPPAPFFASEMACMIANFVTTPMFAAQLPGKALENRAIVTIGKECVVAGFASFALGARVALLSERRMLQDVTHNVRLHLRESNTLDQKRQLRSKTISAVPVAGIGQLMHDELSGQILCELLNTAPPLDVVLVAASDLFPVRPEPVQTEVSMGIEESMRHADLEPTVDGVPFFELLNEVVPRGAPTRVLLVCNKAANSRRPDDTPQRMSHRSGRSSRVAPSLPHWLKLPDGWCSTFCCNAAPEVPIFALERRGSGMPNRSFLDAQAVSAGMRRFLPPMGSSSGKCGCGGHPQRNFLNHCVVNGEWHKNRLRLKEALANHNKSKQGETTSMLEEARAWAVATRDSQTFSSVLPTPNNHGDSWFAFEDSLDFDFLDFEDDIDERREPPSREEEKAGRCRDVAAAGAPPTPKDGALPRTDEPSEAPDPEPPPWKKHGGGVGHRLVPLRAQSLRGRRDHSVRSSSHHGGRTIVDRLASPPHWYRCNRPMYG